MTSPTNLDSISSAELTGALSVQELRLWSAPETILAVTDLSDEECVLYHAVRQARRSAAKVLIAHVLPGVRSSSRTSVRQTASVEIAQRTLERMARKLRWVGISSEPVLLRGDAAEEIIVLAKMRCVNRVLLTAWRYRSPLSRTVAEEIAPWIGVPVCVVPAALSAAAAAESATSRILLALSLRSESEIPLAFACRLAQHHQGTLIVAHVFAPGEVPAVAAGVATFASGLPSASLREARLLCPTEIIALTGDPTAELLKIATELNPDFLLVGVARSPYPDQAGIASVAPGMVNQARCPVILLGHRAAQFSSQEVSPSMSVPA